VIELPEAMVLSKQLSNEFSGKVIVEVITAQNPHKFAWFSGDPALYIGYLTHKRIEGAVHRGVSTTASNSRSRASPPT